MIEDAIPPARLHELLQLREDGVLLWKARFGDDRGTLAFNGRFAGAVAGNCSDSECHIDVRITLNGRAYTTKAHRIVLAMHLGFWPDRALDVDHADGNRHNNRPSNLRVCTRLENCRNMKMRSTNVSGFKGVSWSTRDRKWYARIQFGGKLKYLGVFDDAPAAAQAYDDAAAAMYGAFAKTNAMLALTA